MTALRQQPTSVRARAAVLAFTATALLAFVPAAPASQDGVSAFWQRLAKCETDGRWDWGKFARSSRRRSAEGTTFEGGLGFYAPTWRTWAKAVHVLGTYPHAWMAPPPVQVKVAAYGLRRGGYWGCLHR